MEGSKTMRTHKRTHRSNSKMGRRAGIGFLSLVMVPLGLFSVLSEDVSTETATPASAAVPAPTEEQLERAYANLPLSFEATLGQTDAQVKFLSRGLGYTLFLTADEAVLSLGRPAEPAEPLGDLVPLISTSPAGDGTRAVLRMRLVGARPDPETRGLEPLPGRSHYLTGRDAAEWRTEVPRYAKVEYLTVYPGIDLLYYGNQGALEYDFIVSPGADPAAIVLGFEGADPLEINSQGDLLLRTAAGEIRGFEIGAYDPSRPLVIDPRKVYSTYLGGSLHDEVLGIAVDPNDSSAYVTGIAWSADFPTVSPIQGSNGGSYDAFVAKINAAGSALVFSTYLGGNAWDRGQAITWDDDWGEIVVAGTTYSSNFPTQNPLQGSLSGPADAFMTRLKSDGSAIQYSTYLGGSAWDGGGGGIWSYGGKMATAGMTYSTDFPTANPSQASNAGGMDAFVTYFKDDGTVSSTGPPISGAAIVMPGSPSPMIRAARSWSPGPRSRPIFRRSRRSRGRTPARMTPSWSSATAGC